MPTGGKGYADFYMSKLKTKLDQDRIDAAKELLSFVGGELKENSEVFVTDFINELMQHVSNMANTNDASENKAAVYAIVALMNLESGMSDQKRVLRFFQLLKKILLSADQSVMSLAACAMAQVGVTSKSYGADPVAGALQTALEWLHQLNYADNRKLVAVLVIRELARYTPTLFFQKADNFFDCLPQAVRDPKAHIREEVIATVRAALVVISQRELKQTQKKQWYLTRYTEAKACYDESLRSTGAVRDDRLHACLLMFNELIRIANVNAEKQIQAANEMMLEEDTNQENDHRPGAMVGGVGQGSQSSHENLVTMLSSPPVAPEFESKTARDLVASHFSEMCECVMHARSSKSAHCISVTLELMHRLVAFDSQAFPNSYLCDFVQYMLSCAVNVAHRPLALVTLGLTCQVATNKTLLPLKNIFATINSLLPSGRDTNSRRKGVAVEASVFTCVTLLVSSLKEDISAEIANILPALFVGGLSPGLTVCLREVALSIPGLRHEVQDGLLKHLSVIIMHRPMPDILGPPPKLEPPAPGSLPITNVDALVLALKTLANFHFSRHYLEMFLQYIAYGYMECDIVRVRVSCVVCCCRLLVPFVMLFERLHDVTQSQTLLTMIHRVMDKLLAVAVTDPDKRVRLCVYECLYDVEKPFFMHLAQVEMLSLIFMSLQDEVFQVRKSVIRLLGKLADINPAYVMPKFRSLLIQLLGELKSSGIGRLEEQSALLLSQLVACSPKFMTPYMYPVLQTLLPKLKNPRNVDVTICVLEVVGQLAQVGGPELAECFQELLPILVTFIQDVGNVTKREVALWVLGQLVQTTGLVVQTYNMCPQLLDILLKFLKTEQSQTMRREVVRVLGILGAIDPYEQKVASNQVISDKDVNTLALTMPHPKQETKGNVVQWFNFERYTLKEFYPAFAITSLMYLLEDHSLHDLHKDVIDSLINIFKKLGSAKSLPFVEQVVPRFITVIRNCRPELREFFVQQLGNLIAIVRSHIKPYLPDIFGVIKELWTPSTPLRQTIMVVVEQLATALTYEFKPYVPELMPAMLKVFMHDDSAMKVITAKQLDAFKVCASCLEDHMHLVVPPIVRVIEDYNNPIPVRRSAVETLVELCNSMSLAALAPRILPALIRVLPDPDLSRPCMNLVLHLAAQMETSFLVFKPRIDMVLAKHKLPIKGDYRNKYDQLMMALQTVGHTPAGWQMTARIRAPSVPPEPTLSDAYDVKKVNFNILEKTIETSQLATKDDWSRWLVNLRINLLKQSPYASLRACGSLAEAYEPLARDLFDAAFMSVLTEMTEEWQERLTECLRACLHNSEHADIIHTILNLSEFVGHSEQATLNIDAKELGHCAMNTRAYAKALRFTELQINEILNGERKEKIDVTHIENLITLNNKLQLQEEAIGVVEFAKKHKVSLHMQGRWHEKLHQWDVALEMYEAQGGSDYNSPQLAHSKMKCLEALGEWNKLNSLSKEYWKHDKMTEELRPKFAQLAAIGAWGSGDWSAMESYVPGMHRNTADGAFLQAVLAVHKDQFRIAQTFIDQARDILDTDLTSLASESYERAYNTMVSIERLSELEECMQYKLIPNRRQLITRIWADRLRGCRQSVEEWKKLLQVRSLVLNTDQMRHSWMKYASLCAKHDKMVTARKVLISLLDGDPSKPGHKMPVDKPELVLAWSKHLWNEKKHFEAFDQLKQLSEVHLRQATKQMTIQAAGTPIVNPNDLELLRIAAKCYVKLGEWMEAKPELCVIGADTGSMCNSEAQLNPQGQPQAQARAYYRLATDHAPHWYKAWHQLASCNFAAMKQHKTLQTTKAAELKEAKSDPTRQQALLASKTQNEKMMIAYAQCSVRCFFQAINLCQGSRLQDTLRLLSVWFEHGHQHDVYDALAANLPNVPAETWLQVIPQLIARIDSPRHLVVRLIKQLLTDIGKVHPQALVYPLTVASKSPNKARSEAANELLQVIAMHRIETGKLVQQARLVSEELIRVAILWQEQWHEGLEEASRQYFVEKNIPAMFATLEPLHRMIEHKPTTQMELTFHETYSRDLAEAKALCDRYKLTACDRDKDVKQLSLAWDLYYHVFKRISKQLPTISSIDLQYASPKLLMCRDVDLAVPGAYDPNKPLCSIHCMQPNLQVISSKQRPRKITIRGSDGQDYIFLLKGHEDPRQDERVMQLFGLVNTLLLQQPDTRRRNLTIQRYSIIPLSHNSGLIGWVPNCDTLHALLRDYRDKKKVLINIEHKLMQRMASHYEQLTLMQKVEVFEHGLQYSNGAGNDLQHILWLKSPNSEVWFRRRTNYTRSLATMSMVGYILGLGDRHPSNLMLDRLSGKMVHIDFGDCFEVAMNREKFPEKIPFRLTRMLINAMEVTGTEGNYVVTCERVLKVIINIGVSWVEVSSGLSCVKVLRDNNESVLAVLEAFVYDPLINWRLLDQGGGPKKTAPTETIDTMDKELVGSSLLEEGGAAEMAEAAPTGPSEAVRSKKALQVIQRIQDKLHGRDFAMNGNESVDVKEQVSLLIGQATSHENLCQCYIGWCPFW